MDDYQNPNPEALDSSWGQGRCQGRLSESQGFRGKARKLGELQENLSLHSGSGGFSTLYPIVTNCMTYIYIYIHIYIYVCVCACAYVCMYDVLTHIHAYHMHWP